MGNEIIIGTRGSALALWQTRHVESLLRAHDPELSVTTKIIKTTGDRERFAPLVDIGGKGAFTKELEDALLAGEIDIAVHSLKDLPTKQPEGLVLGAILERAQAEDVFLSNNKDTKLFDLPSGAVIATGSLRRKAQVLARRPDYSVIDIRGNVPTRVEKLHKSTWSGMILAGAGIFRLGLDAHVAHLIPLQEILPAPGQGAIAIEMSADKPQITAILRNLHHEATATAVRAERAVLHALGGGCQLPLGTYGRIESGELRLDACIAKLDGKDLLHASATSKPEEADALGMRMAETLLGMGGFAILESLPTQNNFNSIIGTM